MLTKQSLTTREALQHFEAIEASVFQVLSKTQGGLGESRILVAEAVRAAESAVTAILRLGDFPTEAQQALKESHEILHRILLRLNRQSATATN
jgi:hypothetical protein